MASSKVQTIDKVVLQARQQYTELMESDNISKHIRIDGLETRGQIEDNSRQTNIKEEQTKTVATMLNVPVKRGSYVEIRDDDDVGEVYSLLGVVTTIPNRTPVDYLYTVLLFNTVAKRVRKVPEYDDNGYIINTDDGDIEEIQCFVNRVGQRERQLDAGIDRDSTNELITVKGYDIQIDDILYIGSDSYKVTDIEELNKDYFKGYMTYYRV